MEATGSKRGRKARLGDGEAQGGANAAAASAAASAANEGDELRRSAFLPYKPRTVLTNLQRGNVQTETVVAGPARLSFHQRAGRGELTRADVERNPDEVRPVVNGHFWLPVLRHTCNGHLTLRVLNSSNTFKCPRFSKTGKVWPSAQNFS